MSNNDPNRPNQQGWKFDPQTGERVPPPSPQPEQPSLTPPPASQPEQPTYTPPAGSQPPQPAYTQPVYPQPAPPPYNPVPPNQEPPGGYRVQPEQQGYPPQQPYYQQPPQTPPGPAAPYTPTPQVNVSQPPKRGNSGLLIGGLVVLLLVAGAVAAWFVLGRTIARPAATADRVLPANALGYFTIDPVLDGSQKAAMDKLGEAFKSQPGFEDAWTKITEQAGGLAGDSETAQNCVDGMSDFGQASSYLGNNLTVAMLPPSTSDLEGVQNGDAEIGDVLGRNVIGMLDLDFNPLNKQAPAAELQDVTKNVANTELVEKYRDMEIRRATICESTVYFTLLDGSSTAVLAAQAAPLKLVMDEYKDNKGLKEDARFKALQSQVPAERIATFYINLTELYKQIGFIEPSTVEAVQGASGAMLLTLSAENEGLRLDVASEVDFENNALGMSTDVQINPNARPDVNTISDVPANSLAFALGTDLQTVLQGAIDAMRSSGGDAAAGLEDTITQIEDYTGSNLEQDILPLMSGDWAISVTPDVGAPFPVAGLVFQMKLKLGDQAKAQDIIANLALNGSGGETQQVEVDGNTFYTLSPDGTIIMGTHGDRVIFSASFNGQPAEGAVFDLVDNLGKGVGSTDRWRETAKHLPQNSNMIGHVDFNGIRDLVEATLEGDALQEYETTAAPFVRPFQYLLFGSSTQAPEGTRLSRNHTVIFLGIGQ